MTPTGYSTSNPELEVAAVEFGVIEADDEFDATVVCSPASGSVFTAFSTTVTCVATDGNGLTAEKSFTVSIATANAPTFTASVSENAQGKIEKEATSAPRTMVEFMAPVARDALTPSHQLDVTCTPGSGSLFTMGTTEVVCHTADAGGKVRSIAAASSLLPSKKRACLCPRARSLSLSLTHSCAAHDAMLCALCSCACLTLNRERTTHLMSSSQTPSSL